MRSRFVAGGSLPDHRPRVGHRPAARSNFIMKKLERIAGRHPAGGRCWGMLAALPRQRWKAGESIGERATGGGGAGQREVHRCVASRAPGVMSPSVTTRSTLPESTPGSAQLCPGSGARSSGARTSGIRRRDRGDVDAAQAEAAHEDGRAEERPASVIERAHGQWERPDEGNHTPHRRKLARTVARREARRVPCVHCALESPPATQPRRRRALVGVMLPPGY